MILGSDNAKEVLYIPKEKRSVKALSKLTLDNEEIAWVMHNVGGDYSGKSKSRFLSNLILSQKGPFDATVFDLAVESLEAVNSLIHLRKNTNINVGYSRWLHYLVKASPENTMKAFIKNSFKINGANIVEKPFNYEILDKLASIKHMTIDNVIASKFMSAVLGSMAIEEKLKWYKNNGYSDVTELGIIYDPETPTSVFEQPSISYALVNTTGIDTKKKVAAHKNCPDSLKEQFFNNTNDPALLYGAARNFFHFPE